MFPVFQLNQGLPAVQGHLFLQMFQVTLAGQDFLVFRKCQDLLENQAIHSHQVDQDCQTGHYHPLIQVVQLDPQDLMVQRLLSNLEPQTPQLILPDLWGLASPLAPSDPVVQDLLKGQGYLFGLGNLVNLWGPEDRSLLRHL